MQNATLLFKNSDEQGTNMNCGNLMRNHLEYPRNQQ